MKFNIEHKDGNLTISITNRNRLKNQIENGKVIQRECGDCKNFLTVNDFNTRRGKDGERKLNSKCKQCHKIRKLIRRSFRGYEKDSSTENILGIEYKNFLVWLDQGKLKHTDKNLHIDHVVPQSLGKTMDDMKILNHYSNLQLMGSVENLQKSNRYIHQSDLSLVLSKTPDIIRLRQIISDSGIIII